ncbi:MAG TPA: alanine racemase [Acidimicrobiales bacterium]|nr:alanine racemase [Acidimicrobiales bacterium]
MAEPRFVERRSSERWRPAWADVDLTAVRHNAGLLCRVAAPAGLCAVVKADGYGHGGVSVARAAVDGGATWLAVALVEEGLALRQAGVEVPILLLSEPPLDAMPDAVSNGIVPTVYTRAGVDELAKAAAAVGRAPVDVHLKVDTGMHRVGAGIHEVVGLAGAVAAAGPLRLGALWTHLAVAEGAGQEEVEFTLRQLERFEEALGSLAESGHRPALTHVANSAGAIALPASRRDLVRCGISVYGVAPTPALGDALAGQCGGEKLRPVLSLRTRVTYVRELEAGERLSYGLRRPLPSAATVATCPIGYADGVPRRLFDSGGEVLIRGRRRPLAGTVTMDQIVVDCGPPGEGRVEVGDEVVLLGRQGNEEITADEWAARLGTISYEVLCGIGPRVPRRPRD